jgi:hypothetical protein
VNRPPSIAGIGERTTQVRSSFASVVTADHPAGFWRLGDAAMERVRGEIAGTDGTYFGSVIPAQPGALGDGNSAVLFDGASGYALLPHPTASLAGDLTLELWVHLSLTSRQTLLSMGAFNEFELTVERDGRLNFYNGNGAAYASILSPANVIRANRWHHVVVTRVAAAQSITFYVDGIVVGGGTMAMASAARASAGPITVGRSPSLARYVDGRLDDVAIYPVALSPAHVAAHYAASNGTGRSLPVLLQLAAADPDGQPLTYSATGLPSGLTLNPATGVISGEVPLHAAGTYAVTLTVSDGAASASVGLTWTVVVVGQE